MPLLPLLILLLLPLLIVAALPFATVQRYRMGKARRPARKWVAVVNLAGMIFSVSVFVWATALTNYWVPNAFRDALYGLLVGALLGLLGLAITRWEDSPRTLHYTPNRWLVLFLTTIVTARVLYSFWRGWHVWASGNRGTSWLAESGAAGALGVGAVVLAYYAIYAAGVYLRIKKMQRRWTPLL